MKPSDDLSHLSMLELFRAEAEARSAHYGIPVFVPPLSLSTDNAAMIGAAAMRLIEKGAAGDDYGFNAEASLALGPYA